MANPRPLTNYEWAAFMTEVQPDNLPIPAYGAIVEWEGRYILVFLDARNEWRLTDISGGVPWGDKVIPVSAIVAAYDRQYQDGVAFWALVDGFADGVANVAGAIGYTAGWTVAEINAGAQAVAGAVGQGAGSILAPTLSSLTIPLIAVGIAALLIYLPRPQR